MCGAGPFRLSICLFISAEVGLLCKQVFLDLGKNNIGDLLAIIYHSTSCGSCTECSKRLWVGDWRWRSSDKYFSVSRALQIWFISSTLGDCLQVLGFRNNLLHVLTGGKDYTHWWNKLYVCVYPGCITLLPRSLHVKSCRDRVIISSGFQEKGGCPLIRACSVITSNTVFYIYVIYL